LVPAITWGHKKIKCSSSKALEVVALDIFAKNGWRSNNRLCFWFFVLCVSSFSCFKLCCVMLQSRKQFPFSKKKWLHEMNRIWRMVSWFI
jgi:hypothetical protein